MIFVPTLLKFDVRTQKIPTTATSHECTIQTGSSYKEKMHSVNTYYTTKFSQQRFLNRQTHVDVALFPLRLMKHCSKRKALRKLLVPVLVFLNYSFKEIFPWTKCSFRCLIVIVHVLPVGNSSQNISSNDMSSMAILLIADDLVASPRIII